MPVSSTPATATITPRSLSERLTGKFFWLFVMALVVATVAVFYFVFFTTWQSALSGESDLSTITLQQTVTDVEQQLAAVKQHDAQLKQLPQSDITRMSIALPSGPSIPELLVQLEALTRDTGMLNASFTTELKEKTVAAGNAAATDTGSLSIESIPTLSGSFHFSVTSYEQVKSIIGMLQRNLRLLDGTALQYDPTTQSVVFNFVTYYIQ